MTTPIGPEGDPPPRVRVRVAKLDRRLRRVEDDATDAVEAAADAGKEIARVERRLAALSREVRRLR